MADNKKGFFQDNEGNFSSGRFTKIISLIVAIIITITGAIMVMVKPNIAIQITDYVFKMSGLFLGVATGAEIVQKITGR